MATLLAVSPAPAADTVSHPFRGVTLIERDQDVKVVRIDLNDPGIGFRVTESNGPAGGDTNLEETRDYVGRVNAQIGINGNFFDNSVINQLLGTTTVVGPAASDGAVYGSSDSNSALRTINLSTDNLPSIGPANVTAGLHNAISGFILVENGVNQDPNNPGSGSTNRSAIGFNQNGDQLILLAASNKTLFETGALLIEFGARTALQLDGGGSTALVMDFNGDGQGPQTLLGGGRRVGNSLAVFAAEIPEPSSAILLGALAVSVLALRHRPTAYAKTQRKDAER